MPLIVGIVLVLVLVLVLVASVLVLVLVLVGEVLVLVLVLEATVLETSLCICIMYVNYDQQLKDENVNYVIRNSYRSYGQLSQPSLRGRLNE